MEWSGRSMFFNDADRKGEVLVPSTLAILCLEDGYELDWDPSFQKLSEALLPASTAAVAVPWSKIGSHRANAVSPLLAWGYQRKIGAWYKMLDCLLEQPVTINSLELLRWNCTKHYLFDLYRAGISIVPTIHRSLVTRSDLVTAFRVFGTDALIVKPAVGASSDGLIQVTSADADGVSRDLVCGAGRAREYYGYKPPRIFNGFWYRVLPLYAFSCRE